MRRRAETVASLQAFRKRHADAQRIQSQLSAQPTTVDLAHYRSILKNKAVVDEAEKLLKDFKPVTYDVSTHVKAIETFETKAVSVPEITDVLGANSLAVIQVAKAQETADKIDVELKDLQATLANIEDARPFEDLTVRAHLSLKNILGQHLTMVLIAGRRCTCRAPAYRRGCRDQVEAGSMDCAW